MTKKFFLISLLFFFFPLLSLATTTNCCKIHTTFKYAGQIWESGNCYGETSTKCVAPDQKELCPNTIVREDWAVACMLNVVYAITDIAFGLLLALGILVGLGGGYYILTAGSDPEKINKGKDFIIYAILGLLVALFAKAIPSIVIRLLG